MTPAPGQEMDYHGLKFERVLGKGDLYTCLACGSIVQNLEAHRAWHAIPEDTSDTSDTSER